MAPIATGKGKAKDHSNDVSSWDLEPLKIQRDRTRDDDDAQVPKSYDWELCRELRHDGKTYEFHRIINNTEAFNKISGLRYYYVFHDKGFEHVNYRSTDIEPFHARWSFEDTSPHSIFSPDGLSVSHQSLNSSWRSGHANVFAREGTWYFEVKVIEGLTAVDATTNGSSKGFVPHIRVGFEGRMPPEETVGSYIGSYGLRDSTGHVHTARMDTTWSDPEVPLVTGTVIGCMIKLPPLSVQQKVLNGTYDYKSDTPSVTEDDPLAPVNIVRDRMHFHSRKEKNKQVMFEQAGCLLSQPQKDFTGHTLTINDPNPSFRALPNSSITFFINGQKHREHGPLACFLPPANQVIDPKTQHADSKDGRHNADDGTYGYYPTISTFCGGAVEARFEAPFFQGEMPPEVVAAGAQPAGFRYTDHIAEDIVADLVDEAAWTAAFGTVDSDEDDDDSFHNGHGNGNMPTLNGHLGNGATTPSIAATPTPTPTVVIEENRDGDILMSGV